LLDLFFLRQLSRTVSLICREAAVCLQKQDFCCETRPTRKITADIPVIFRGLFFRARQLRGKRTFFRGIRQYDSRRRSHDCKIQKRNQDQKKSVRCRSSSDKRVSEIITIALDNIGKNLEKIDSNRESCKKIRKLIKKKDRDKILEVALEKYLNKEELKPYQAELIKLQQHLEKTGKKMIITFDGRDASGKGGTIRRVTRYMNEKHYRVVALGKPSKTQQTELHMKRYIEQFPRSGEIVLFDRSWYNRAMVKPVTGFCTDAQHKRFLKDAPLFEEMLVKDGIQLFKFYFSVSKKEQKRRFDARRTDPLKQHKISHVDNLAQKY